MEVNLEMNLPFIPASILAHPPNVAVVETGQVNVLVAVVGDLKLRNVNIHIIIFLLKNLLYLRDVLDDGALGVVE
jgi:hypothetical protein